MSEPATSLNGDDYSLDAPVIDEEDTTQPTQDIFNALRQLSSSQQTIPNSQSSQDNILQQSSQISQSDDPSSFTSEWDALRAQVREKPTDVDAWLRLVDTAEDDGNFERINETYEALLEAYPNTVCTPFVNISIV